MTIRKAKEFINRLSNVYCELIPSKEWNLLASLNDTCIQDVVYDEVFNQIDIVVDFASYREVRQFLNSLKKDENV